MSEERRPLLDPSTIADESAIESDSGETTVNQELLYIRSNALTLAATFGLQISLTAASIFTVGHLGKTELGGVSLGAMTANVTAVALSSGVATCLDTMCAQAYGAKQYRMVGVHLQKCIALSLLMFIPIAALWIRSDLVMPLLIDDPAVCALVVRYLRITLIGAPALFVFECTKRYFQAQGLFSVGTGVLFISAPINVVLHLILVNSERFGIGFDGAPIAISITFWLQPILLAIYMAVWDDHKCWPGLLSMKELFSNWGPMIKLAVPGLIMVEAEYLAFEILTFVASRLGTVELGAQSILITLAGYAFCVPFSVSVATSTRVGNYIGAGQIDKAKVACRAAFMSAFVVALLNAAVIMAVRNNLGQLFTSDGDVVRMVGEVGPYLAVFQFVDAPAGTTSGVLKGQGRQHISSNLYFVAYYVFAIPISFWLALYTPMGVRGLWVAIFLGVGIVAFGEAYFIVTADWDSIALAAKQRSETVMAGNVSKRRASASVPFGVEV